MKLRLVLLCALLGLLVMPTVGNAGEILYAGIGNSAGSALPIDGSLVILNQSNASPTLVGQPSTLGITGLVFDNLGNLWGSANSRTAAAPILEEINVSTGAQINSVNLTDANGGGALPIGDLAFQPGSKVLYGVTTSGVIYTINSSTGVGTKVGDTLTGRTGGLAFSVNGTLYMIGVKSAGGDALYTLNPNTGAILTTVTLPQPQFFDGLGIRPSDGALFANLAMTDGIYTIDPNTGVAAFVGNIGNGKASDLAFLVVVPEPGTLALAGVGLLALARIRRRKSADVSLAG